MKSEQRHVVLNIEANGLTPDSLWCATCIDIETGEEIVFRRPDQEPADFLEYMADVDCCVGHNVLNYDIPHVSRLVAGYQRQPRYVDTIVVSRVLDFNRPDGHSLEAWSSVVGVKKSIQPPWDAFSEALVDHSLQNCRITLALYKRFLPYIQSKRWAPVFELEQFVAEELQIVHQNGFHFDVDNATKLRYNINKEVEALDVDIIGAFPPKVSLVKEVRPRVTKFGTLNRNDFRWVDDGDLSYFNGGPFSLIEFVEFNPGSPLQVVTRLNEAGWKPEEKTKGHKLALRAKKKLKPGSEAYKKNEERLAHYAIYGWTVSETNLNTLPDTAPEAAHLLAKRIKYASRVRVLDEWLRSVRADGRIHGTINHIGAWTHRCSHDKPNTGNIPRDDAEFGREMRSLWQGGDGFLVGVDAEGIQLRVLAHYMNDDKFTHSVTSGKKEDGTDPHSLNKRALGEPCKSRNDAKTFIYAWLLGAGIAQVATILGCSYGEAKTADADFLDFYPGLRELKRSVIPYDASRGYFEGFDGRYINIFGDDRSSKEHFTLAGYLQAGEAIVMKKAMTIWLPKLRKEKVPFKLVNFVHDEWQTQVNADYDTALFVANTQADSIREAGELLNLRCPFAGSILSGHGHVAIASNWYETH